jgi:hypothetical protein
MTASTLLPIPLSSSTQDPVYGVEKAQLNSDVFGDELDSLP